MTDQEPDCMSASVALWCELQKKWRGWTSEHTIAWLEKHGREHLPGVWLIHRQGRDALDAGLEPRND